MLSPGVWNSGSSVLLKEQLSSGSPEGVSVTGSQTHVCVPTRAGSRCGS